MEETEDSTPFHLQLVWSKYAITGISISLQTVTFDLSHVRGVEPVQRGDPASVYFVWDDNHANTYFSLVTPLLRLNLQASNEEERDFFVASFRRLCLVECISNKNKNDWFKGGVPSLFKAIDQNGDGKVTEEELSIFLQKVLKKGDKESKERAKLIFANAMEYKKEVHVKEIESVSETSLDITTLNEFTLDYPMFADLMSFRNEEKETLQAFRAFDLDHDGFITSKELMMALNKMGEMSIKESDAEKIISKLDKDGDNKLNYNEFIAMIAAQV